MAILEHELRSASGTLATAVFRHTITRAEYDAMVKAGVFGDARLELIEGELIQMAPIGHPHAAINDPLRDLLKIAFGNGYTVRTQAPISIGDDLKPSAPQPGVAVVSGHWRDYMSRAPMAADLVLVVEIADSSLYDDRRIKAALYASAGIQEYWIVNLIDEQVEVYREPVDDGYNSLTFYSCTDTIAPLAAPNSSISLADFMPL